MATAADAEQIAEQRRLMFTEMGTGSREQMEKMVDAFVPWVRRRLEDGSYLGWLTMEKDRIVAGAGMWLMEFLPHWRDEQPVRAYLTNFYVAPEARGCGLAYGLLKRAVEEARSRGIKAVVLHASRFGRPIYERNGFASSDEMMLYFGDPGH
jgi:GNAT superfamily N-acetyltransferase